MFLEMCVEFPKISLIISAPTSPPPPSLQVESITDTVQQLLSTVEGEGSISEGNLKELKKRQLVVNVYVMSQTWVTVCSCVCVCLSV